MLPIVDLVMLVIKRHLSSSNVIHNFDGFVESSFDYMFVAPQRI
jgi:hypothetical protein